MTSDIASRSAREVVRGPHGGVVSLARAMRRPLHALGRDVTAGRHDATGDPSEPRQAAHALRPGRGQIAAVLSPTLARADDDDDDTAAGTETAKATVITRATDRTATRAGTTSPTSLACRTSRAAGGRRVQGDRPRERHQAGALLADGGDVRQRHRGRGRPPCPGARREPGGQAVRAAHGDRPQRELEALVVLAAKHGLDPIRGPLLPQHRQLIQNLSMRSGQDFDRFFARSMVSGASHGCPSLRDGAEGAAGGRRGTRRRDAADPPRAPDDDRRDRRAGWGRSVRHLNPDGRASSRFSVTTPTRSPARCRRKGPPCGLQRLRCSSGLPAYRDRTERVAALKHPAGTGPSKRSAASWRRWTFRREVPGRSRSLRRHERRLAGYWQPAPTLRTPGTSPAPRTYRSPRSSEWSQAERAWLAPR